MSTTGRVLHQAKYSDQQLANMVFISTQSDLIALILNVRFGWGWGKGSEGVGYLGFVDG